VRIQEFDYSVDVLRSLLWQYNQASNLEALVTAKQAWYDAYQSTFWSDWYRDVFDLRTANDFGLAVWSIILGLPVSVVPSVDPGRLVFGFASDDKNFSNGNFAGAGGVNLTTEQMRIVLRLRYYQLTTRASVAQANHILDTVFGEGVAYVVDGLDMTIRYVFVVTLDASLQFVLTNYDILPRPAGVFSDFISLGGDVGWGFGPYRKNFNNGNFYHA